MQFGGIALAALLLTSALPALAQSRLTYRPIDAAYSTALDRIIFITTGPNQLRIYDPASNTDQTVALSATPLSLSISPNGQYAAVGHDNLISYVNLNTRVVERTYTVALSVRTVVLAADWVYGFNSALYSYISVRLSTGAVTTGSSSAFGAAKLNSAISSLYAASYYLYRLDISGGPITIPGSNSNSNTYGTSQLWVSADGARIYSGNGLVLRSSSTPAQDLTLIGRLPDTSNGIVALAESSSTGRLGVVATPYNSSSPPTTDDHIRLYTSNGFQQVGRFQLSSFLVGTNKFAPHGKWVFFNNAGTSLHAISQADGSAGLLNDFAVQSYALSGGPSCFASFSPSTTAVPASGLMGTVAITADPTCVYQASTTTPWIQLVSGDFGSGDGTLTYHARANSTSSARSGTITLGSQTFTITQDAAPASAPTPQRFSYRIADAEYSKALDRIVLVTALTRELHLYDPVTRGDQYLTLSYPALSVSVRPDGLYAAVGHTGFLSYVNLQTLSVEKVVPITGEAGDVVLASNGYAYYFPSGDGGALYSVQISTGTVTAASNYNSGRLARLQAPGNYIYTSANYGNVGKADIRQGAAQGVSIPNSPYQYCNGIWLSEDGARLYNGCGQVYRPSEVPQQDLASNGSFSATVNRLVQSAANSSTRASTALLVGSGNSYGSPETSEIQLYLDEGLVLQGRLQLTRFSDSTAVRSVVGRFLFWNKAADRLFAVSQVDPAAGLLSDFVVESITPASISGCAVSLPVTSADVRGSGGTLTINVTAGNNCAWSATSTDSWISLYSSNASGAGSGSFQVQIYSNNGSTSRTGFLTIGGQTFTVRQSAPSGVSVYANTNSFTASGGTSSLTVSTSTSITPWTATTDVSWIILTVTSGTGSRTFNFSVAANGGAARTGTISVNGEPITISQSGAPGVGTGMRFVPVTPCRVADTRGEGLTGAFGTPFQSAGSQRDYPISQGRCGIPFGATAYSLNVTVVPKGPLAYLTIWPTGNTRPFVSTLNSFDGRVKANAAIVPVGLNGSVSVYVTDATEVILDINGYFVPANTANTNTSYSFTKLNPCRLVDTRLSTSTNGGPSMTAGQTRSFSASYSNCGSIYSATAYSLNITAIPKSSALGYLTIWPTGSARPLVSTLNSYTGTVVANAAIVPAGTNGDFSVFVTNDADVVIDINGYFSANNFDSFRFYPVIPCRVSDTRNANGPLGGPVLAASQARSFTPTSAACGLPASAAAYVLNATVVPSAPLSFLTIWPTGLSQPLVSTLNAFDGSVTANALIVPAGTAGAIHSYVTDSTHLILDVSGYFAP